MKIVSREFFKKDISLLFSLAFEVIRLELLVIFDDNDNVLFENGDLESLFKEDISLLFSLTFEVIRLELLVIFDDNDKDFLVNGDF